MASSCTVELSHEGVVASCGAIRFEVNPHDVALSAAQRAAIGDAVAELGALVGRPVEDLGTTSAEVAAHAARDPILIEIAWPDDAANALGYAEPAIVDETFVGGWVLLNPLVRHLPPGVLRRLVLHELGHLHGLADVGADDELMNPALTVDDWGSGDLTGLFLTHAGGCPGSTLAAALQASLG